MRRVRAWCTNYDTRQLYATKWPCNFFEEKMMKLDHKEKVPRAPREVVPECAGLASLLPLPFFVLNIFMDLDAFYPPL
jgi:hypothetical protein